MKVRNMRSGRGNPIANQFIISTEEYDYFQSYETVIAKINNDTGFVTLDRNKWDCSNTTGKYRNIFLGESIEETRKKIESDDYEYELADLN